MISKLQYHFKRSKVSQSRGMTLIEVMVAMTIFVVLAGGIIAGVFAVRADAENNLYESSSLNVAISFLEQLKSIEYTELESPPIDTGGKAFHTFIIGFGQTLAVPLDKKIVVNVPIISTTEGVSKKELDVSIKISVTKATDMSGYWFNVEYSWKHPTSNRIYSGEVRGFRAEVPTF